MQLANFVVIVDDNVEGMGMPVSIVHEIHALTCLESFRGGTGMLGLRELRRESAFRS